jgi:hypothetical protein
LVFSPIFRIYTVAPLRLPRHLNRHDRVITGRCRSHGADVIADAIAGSPIFFGVIAMMRIIQDLKIGTKLAITSALALIVVGGMVYFQVTGGADVRSATEKASRQQTIALDAAEAKASVRGMQIGIRDILLATTPEELKKGDDYFAERTASALKFNGEMARLSQSPENRQRIDRQKVLIEGLRNGKDQLETVRKQELAIEAKDTDHSAEASAQMAKLIQKSPAFAEKSRPRSPWKSRRSPTRSPNLEKNTAMRHKLKRVTNLPSSSGCR